MRTIRTSWQTWTILALSAVFALPLTADESGERIVVESKIKNCPVVIGEDGQNVQFLDLSKRGFLGVEVTSLTAELRQHFGVGDDEGVMVSRLVDDGAAMAAGLQVGDIITRVDGRSIDSSHSLGKAIRGHEGGDAVDIEYWRNGRAQSQAVTLAAREVCAFDVGNYFEGVDWEELAAMGARVEEDVLRNIDWEQFGEMGVRISEDALAIALDSLQGVLKDGDWEKALADELEHVEVLDMGRLEERMERVQERLERLEEQLEREMEQVEHKHERAERHRVRAERERERQVERQQVERQRQLEREQERQEREKEQQERERDNRQEG